MDEWKTEWIMDILSGSSRNRKLEVDATYLIVSSDITNMGQKGPKTMQIRVRPIFECLPYQKQAGPFQKNSHYTSNDLAYALP